MRQLTVLGQATSTYPTVYTTSHPLTPPNRQLHRLERLQELRLGHLHSPKQLTTVTATLGSMKLSPASPDTAHTWLLRTYIQTKIRNKSSEAAAHLEVAPTASTHLCAFRSPVHFYTQVISIFLPVQLAINHIEQIPHSDLLSGGELHQGHPGWNIFVFWHPKGNDVTTRRPRKVSVGQRDKVYGKNR